MTPRGSALVAAVALVLGTVACAAPPSTAPAGTASPQPVATSSPTSTTPIETTTPVGPATPSALPGTPFASASAPPVAGSPLIVPVTLTDAIRIEPPQMTIPAGQPVTFVITNAGLLSHEFFVGDAAAQDAHEAELRAAGVDVPSDTETGRAVDGGQTEELTYMFAGPGQWIAGCHILNHYSGGMKATIDVVP